MTHLSFLASAFVGLSLFLAAPAPAHADSGISITVPYAFATAEGQANGAAFMTIASPTQDDVLTNAQSPAAKTVEFHEHTMDGAVMGMRKVDSIAVPMDMGVTLNPMGYHIMLIDLNAPLVAGDTVPLTLTFEKAGTVDVTARIVPPGTVPEGAPAPVMDHDMGHDMDHSGHDMAPAQ
ncbi:MAG: copper chaperone PCu(A)C [Rhodospirillales bacterium]|nr:copper chaperone PCu(A)C [Rhodospirillales bacterium]